MSEEHRLYRFAFTPVDQPVESDDGKFWYVSSVGAFLNCEFPPLGRVFVQHLRRTIEPIPSAPLPAVLGRCEPSRLEIAARVLAATINDYTGSRAYTDAAESALQAADALIAAHEATAMPAPHAPASRDYQAEFLALATGAIIPIQDTPKEGNDHE